MKTEPVLIAGAGLSGLSTAIGLAQRGQRVEVFEKNAECGSSRRSDWDAIENWTTEQDLLACLGKWGLNSAFEHRAPLHFEVLDPAGECYSVGMQKPFFYIVKRGPGQGSIEQALKRQALEHGVTIHYGHPRARKDVDVWAAGARSGGFFLNAGLTFRTSCPDLVMVLVDQRVAPKGYAYLVIVDGFATLSVVLTRDFKAARTYLSRSVAAFRRHRSFSMDDIHMSSGFGGLVGSIRQPAGPAPKALAVGEAGGFQDFLWGFGIRHALHSGQLAARALVEGGGRVAYERSLAQTIRPLVRTSIANRSLYDWGGNLVYRALIRYFAASPDLARCARQWYRGQLLHRLIWPLAQLHVRSR